MAKNETAEALSNLYAVVLTDAMSGNSRVKWSPEHGAWLHNTFDDQWADAPGLTWTGGPHSPRDDELQMALELAPTADEWCSRCGVLDPSAHFIATNVHRVPSLYCVQSSSADVVGSRGGGGRKKHWGGPLGCHNVGVSFEHDWGPGAPYIGTVAVHLYGRPLVAEEVIDWPWCSNCSNAAFNDSTSDSDSTDFMRAEAAKRARWVAENL